MSNLPLEGILVVALEQAVAAPYCSSRLADAGARVIKIERPEGDFARNYDHVAHGESAYFVWLNRGKESLVLDIKDGGDAALLHRIVARADVFIQNLAPGAAERAGFGSATLRERHPRLITVDISGYGEDGPYRDMKAYDLLVQSETGLASITGAPEAPGRVGVSVADIACGMYAHTAVLQALFEREHTGQGRGVAVSLFDCIADWMTVPLLHQDYGGKAPERVGLNHPSIAPYGAFALADGHTVVISIQNEREWRTFCAEVLEQPDLATDPRFVTVALRVANRPALDAAVGAFFATLDRAQATERLRRARIAFGSLNSVADLSEHSQLRRITTDTPTGPVTGVAPPPRWAGETFHPRPVPAVGQHTEALRREFAP
ncbi:CaiB/BaiF CoA transferase family protein [Azospirillum soli]|uniref:CaiB/BaiF CoA transferase family protein n=1 Tax=Azospirillum soli TaxID=1304799 RepID=UPI001AE19249|nr:CaiB/BaiF CoA-transferase family protein [Azospirillum soli]MBP2312820.1 crotonobetainyl-CoA:carnitine CoA-transferase CaiB-like acyl-CoA transferase [Azospirillum soli]